jgi:hypothetical protein
MSKSLVIAVLVLVAGLSRADAPRNVVAPAGETNSINGGIPGLLSEEDGFLVFTVSKLDPDPRRLTGRAYRLIVSEGVESSFGTFIAEQMRDRKPVLVMGDAKIDSRSRVRYLVVMRFADPRLMGTPAKPKGRK